MELNSSSEQSRCSLCWMMRQSQQHQAPQSLLQGKQSQSQQQQLLMRLQKR
jgi:hypothetical protein